MEYIIPVGIGIVVLCIVLFIIFFITGSSQKGLEKTLTRSMNTAIRVQNNIIKNNEDLLKETANINANIKKDAVTTMAHAIKEGFTAENMVYCKHCGSSIDADSKFCKSCGKEQ